MVIQGHPSRAGMYKSRGPNQQNCDKKQDVSTKAVQLHSFPLFIVQCRYNHFETPGFSNLGAKLLCGFFQMSSLSLLSRLFLLLFFVFLF